MAYKVIQVPEVPNVGKKDWMIIESELDDDQIKVLNAVNDKSCIVSGCAGSGKSVLALIKAQRIQQEKGNNYQIIVFTRALCEYMNAGRIQLGLNNKFDYHWQWKEVKRCPSSDYVIVDEIQDFTKEEIQEFVNAAKKNFFFFGDTAQSIYGGLKSTMPVETINQELGTRAKTFELYRNYRLPKTVAKVVQHVGVDLDGFDIDTYKSKETAVPRFVRYNDLDSQINAIADMIKSGRVSDVGILLPNNEDVKRISKMLNQRNINHELRYSNKEIGQSEDSLDFSTGNPKVMTYHSAKGLQFGTVFLPNITEDSINNRKALYVAMTRTYCNLYVMYKGELPFPLSEVPHELYKTTVNDVVEDI